MPCVLRGAGAGLLLLVLSMAALAQARWAGAAAPNVYDRQTVVTEKELLAFLDVLPQFRAWARAAHEEAHPVLRHGRADFLYSEQAAAWVRAKNWEPARFFCVMGRMAAALALVADGDEAVRARDMPAVAAEEMALARRHLGSLLRAGGDAPPELP